MVLLAGGNGQSSVEVYSPNGKCNYALAPLPTAGTNFGLILSYINQVIFACGGPLNKNCWKYNVASNSWSLYTTSKFTHDYRLAATYNNQLFFEDELNPEVFDPLTNTWSSWPAPPIKTGDGPCMVVWKDTFVLIGGYTTRRGVQSYSHTTKTWKVLSPVLVPSEMVYAGCILLPNRDEVLIVGSEDFPFGLVASVYNITSNTFTALSNVTVNRAGSKIVQLGDRIFVTDGHGGSTVDEYFPNSHTWARVSVSLKTPRSVHHGAAAMSASLFANIPGGCSGV